MKIYDSKYGKKLRNTLPPTWVYDHITIRGYSHKLNGKECQDASCSWESKKCCGIIVCDGHGGEKYIRSAVGSKFAVKVGREVLSEFMANALKRGSKLFLSKHSTEANLDRLQRTITMRWRDMVQADLQEHPLADDDRYISLSDREKASLAAENEIKAYGTTFIAGIFSREFLFVVKLGDGNACIVLDDGSVLIPEELSDPQLQFNSTTSLCNSDAALQFRNYFARINEEFSPAALILSTDGIINCYHTGDAFKSLIQNISKAYYEEKKEDAHVELEGVLDTLSEKGSGDDLSIAIVRRL